MSVENLTDRRVRAAKARDGNKRGTMLGDGRGLYLRVMPSGSKHWIFRYKRDGKSHELGLGAYPAVTLADARDKAIANRRQIAAGTDPLTEKRAAAVLVREITFADAAKLIEAKADNWKARTRQQWESALRDHAKPLASLNVRDITTAIVFGLLEDLWKTQRPTGMRVRTYIETVLDWSIAHAYRTGPNPAAWDGNLEHMGLADASTLERKTREHVPPAEKLRSWRRAGLAGKAARALRIIMLTARRANEVLGATWDEFDLTKRVWRSPPRMKMKVLTVFRSMTR
jgi:integrase